jgi:hypothetical protein
MAKKQLKEVELTNNELMGLRAHLRNLGQLAGKNLPVLTLMWRSLVLAKIKDQCNAIAEASTLPEEIEKRAVERDKELAKAGKPSEIGTGAKLASINEKYADVEEATESLSKDLKALGKEVIKIKLPTIKMDNLPKTWDFADGTEIIFLLVEE